MFGIQNLLTSTKFCNEIKEINDIKTVNDLDNILNHLLNCENCKIQILELVKYIKLFIK